MGGGPFHCEDAAGVGVEGCAVGGGGGGGGGGDAAAGVFGLVGVGDVAV